MTIVDPTQPPSGGHPTPEVRQDEDRAWWDRPKRAPFVMIPHDMITGSISATALQVAAALARHADAKGEAWPSMPTVAARLNSYNDLVNRPKVLWLALEDHRISPPSVEKSDAATPEVSVAKKLGQSINAMHSSWFARLTPVRCFTQ